MSSHYALSNILQAGIEINNVTNHLSDHFPVYASWIPYEFQGRKILVTNNGEQEEIDEQAECISKEQEDYVLEPCEEDYCFIELFQ